MKSIFHIEAATPEDLRREVVAWHKAEAQRAQAEFHAHKRPNNATVLAYHREINCHDRAAKFWEEVHIDLLQWPNKQLEDKAWEHFDSTKIHERG